MDQPAHVSSSKEGDADTLRAPGPPTAPSSRETLLLELTDTMRGAGSTHVVLDRICALLGPWFGVNRVGYGQVDAAIDSIEYDVCWTSDASVPPLLGKFPASAFGQPVIDRLRAGETVVISNVREHEWTSDATTVQTSHEVDTRAILVVPLVKAGRLRIIGYLNQRDARVWTAEEVALMQDVCERTRELIERGRVEQALRESEARWRGLFETMAEGFFLAEPVHAESGRMVDFRFLEVNPAFETLTGKRASTAPGRTAREVIGDVPQELIDRYARVLETGESVHFETFIPVLEDRWYEVRARRIEPGKFTALFMDVTSRKLSELAMQQQQAELIEADKRKNEFLATLAHELRNPLAPLRTGLAILHKADIKESSAVRARELMDRQLSQLVHLVDDLLDVSRVSQGKVVLKRAPASAAELIQMAVETARPLIDAANHQLYVELPPQPLILSVDPHRIAQVLANLLNNAAKYTPSGGRISLRATLGGSLGVRFVVEDNGIGLAPEMLERIFDLFAQVGSPGQHLQEGLGIGLSLARQLVELHGGTLHAISPGLQLGSTFILDLPLADVASSELNAGEGISVAQQKTQMVKRILICDDNVDGAEMLRMLLEIDGHDVRVVHSGRAAIELADDLKPDVVLLDIGLPDMTGYEVARVLRQHASTDGILLVALTGWGAERDQQRSREAGFDLHLTKPVTPEELQKVLEAQRR